MPDTQIPIRHPAKFVPYSAVAIGAPGEPAIAITPATPLPSSDQPFRNAQALAFDVAVTPGLGLLVDCAASGVVVLEFAGGAQIALTMSPGITLLPFAVTQILSVGTTATLSAWVLS